MKTQDLTRIALDSLNLAQNYPWIPDPERGITTDYARIGMMDAQTRALIAIAQELQRMNDFHEAITTGTYQPR